MVCEGCGHQNPPLTPYCEKCQEKLYQAKLRITLDNGQDQSHFLFPRRYKIGRAKENEIVILDESVSRFHAEIWYAHDQFYLRDKNSKNGTLINQIRVTQKTLRNFDCIQLGHVVAHFYEDRNPATSVNGDGATVESVRNQFFARRQTPIRSDELLQFILELSISLTHADEGLFFLFMGNKGLQYKFGRNRMQESIARDQASLNWEVVKECIEDKKLKIIYDEMPLLSESIVQPHSPNWQKMAVPLLATQADEAGKGKLGWDGVLGVFYFTQKQSTGELPAEKINLLLTLVQHAAIAVENDWLYDEALANRKIQDELALAREIQQRLLPRINLLTDGLEVASFMQPCEAVSGDYFDVIPISEACTGIAIGDICGKGVPAALLFSSVLAAIRTQLEYTASPKQIVGSVNQLLLKCTAESIFLTLFFGVYDKTTGTIRYVNAGHPPPVIINNRGKINELRGTTHALGILEADCEKERVTPFKSGNVLLLYTDGLIESQNHRKNIYGRKKLLTLLETILQERGRVPEPQSLIDAIKDNLFEFLNGGKLTDDITLLAIKKTSAS